jgi:O-antigen ligase
MEAIAHKSGDLHAALLGLIAAVSTVSVITVSYQGTSASTYALVGVGLLALFLLFALAYLRPMVTLVIALAFMTSPIPLFLTLPQSALISAFLLGGASLGLALRASLRSLAADPLFLPIGVFASFGVVSAVHGLWVGNEVAYVVGDCFQIIEFALVYFLVAQLLRNIEDVRLFLRLLLVPILLTILVELTLFALGPDAVDLLPSWQGASASESLVRTIDINAAILFAVLFNLYPITRSRRQRFWIRVAFIPTVASIALSLSRGLWLCTLVAVIASLILQGQGNRKRLLKAFAVASICVVLLAAAWKIGSDSDSSLLSVFEERVLWGVDQVEEGFAGQEGLATRRFLEMVIVGPQVLAKPWIGHGLGATYVIGGFAVLDAGTNAPIDHHFIHNLYLVTAFRMGVIGLGLMLWVLFRYFRRIWRAYRNMPLDSNKALVAGFAASVVGQLFLSLTQPTVVDHPTCALIACAMALSFRLASTAPNHRQQMALTYGA